MAQRHLAGKKLVLNLKCVGMCRKGQKPLILPDAFDGEVVA
jgi:hypothetical protein